MEYLTDQREKEQKRKNALCEVFDETQKYAHSIREMNDTAVQEIKKIFPEIARQLKSEKDQVKDEKAPILVLGRSANC